MLWLEVCELISLDIRNRDDSKFNLLVKQIAAWTADIAAQNPDLVSRSVIGETYEGQPIYLLQVSA